MCQLDSVTWSSAGGSSPVDSGYVSAVVNDELEVMWPSESSSLPTLSRETSSFGTDFSSPFTSGVWPVEPLFDTFAWGNELIPEPNPHSGWWPLFQPVEEGYLPWSDTYNPFDTSYGSLGHSANQPQPIYDPRALSPSVQTAQLAADLLQLDAAINPADIELPSTKKVGISRTTVRSKERKGHECPDCGKSCVRPSDLLRHKQDIHALAEQ
ncbi:hypothetical protein CLAFUW4_08515 [Fulvia fulva]|uniref:C2H2-type domain-containing protein n=1 Tax=Passalora fulva TaxID=5499 RepID=A0A9Q8LCY5_PASFU|nr:uncharacterized protein CLAFUR5_08617 [Fulvia fulva]KAK4629724.1 hypothetical protein CLAFUR4_08520 [Fulvia fulva]KAK4630099.1 hypothetical protein CLAFUR0_08515 [Fulvia fulva]UJO15200.1 hypothetical protein CLAFUR5_08617 [Fulvia fulva]WPV12818.1 hypothetical protein CLAFUW4_08515 [Fulvia fulva]WPV28007.1 hypothetical protein CLAFUW7_08515 [Fulvia fulva]